MQYEMGSFHFCGPYKIIFVFSIERKKNKSFLYFSFQTNMWLSSTLSWCLCLCFWCDISHYCDTFLSKWKAPDLAKMFSWQRMKSVVSASSPGRSSSANLFCLNWRHPLKFVVSKSFVSKDIFKHFTWMMLTHYEQKTRLESGLLLRPLCYYRNREHWLIRAQQCSGCFVFDVSKELPSCLLLISQYINNYERQYLYSCWCNLNKSNSLPNDEAALLDFSPLLQLHFLTSNILSCDTL